MHSSGSLPAVALLPRYGGTTAGDGVRFCQAIEELSALDSLADLGSKVVGVSLREHGGALAERNEKMAPYDALAKLANVSNESLARPARHADLDDAVIQTEGVQIPSVTVPRGREQTADCARPALLQTPAQDRNNRGRHAAAFASSRRAGGAMP